MSERCNTCGSKECCGAQMQRRVEEMGGMRPVLSDDDLRVEAGNAFLADEEVGITDEAASLDPTHAETYGAGYIKGYRAACEGKS